MRTCAGLALLPFALACGPGDIQVLAEGRHDLTQTLRADRIEVMPGAKVYLADGVTLEASEDLRLAGEIFGMPGSSTLELTAGQDIWILGKVSGYTGPSAAAGQAVRVVAGRDLVVRGVLRGGDGGAGAAADGPGATAGPGGVGGPVVAEAGRDLLVSGVVTGGLGGDGGAATDLTGSPDSAVVSGRGGDGGVIEFFPTRQLGVTGAVTGGRGGASGTARVKATRASATVSMPGAGGRIVRGRSPSRAGQVLGTVRGGDSGKIGVGKSFADGIESASVARSASAKPGGGATLSGDDGRNAGAAAAWARIPDMSRQTLEKIERRGKPIPASRAASEPMEVVSSTSVVGGVEGTVLPRPVTHR